MEFPFDLEFLNSDSNGICVWNGDFKKRLSVSDLPKFSKVIDKMGRASCKAQGLGQPVTATYLLQGTNHTLYMICNAKMMIGILKIGHKSLFIHDLHQQYVEMTPLCVLDFYIHETYQRKGIGQLLFNFMLKCQDIKPRFIAYDAPSSKLLNFLNKHYGLKSFTPQNCNFVVYHDYFNKTNTEQHQEASEIVIQYSADNEQQLSEIAEIEEIAIEPNSEIVDIENDEKTVDLIESDKIKYDDDNNNMLLTLQYEPYSHQKQLDEIQKQIEKTKLEISQSENKIYQYHLKNNISPYGSTHPTNAKLE